MSLPNDRLYALLPGVIRQRDAQTADAPLRSLLSVISEQVDLVEDNIAQLYDDLFIETCADWAVPYIGDAIGYEVLHEAGEPSDATTASARNLNRILISRADVANTVGARRRKGTLAVLVDLARDVAGWPALAVEFDRRAALTQALDDLHLARGRTLDVRDRSVLERIGSPHDGAARSADLRGPGPPPTVALQTSGVGLFVPRYRAYSVSNSTAAWISQAGDHCFTFSALGNNVTLFSGAGLPLALRRGDVASDAHYGAGKSLAIWTRGEGDNRAPVLVGRERIVPANLGHWREPRAGTVAVDAVLGRISFPPDEVPAQVLVAYHYGFSFDIGAGEYDRATTGDGTIYSVASKGGESHERLSGALERWKADRPARAVIEFGDSEIYDEDEIDIELQAGQTLEIRAASGARPVIRMIEWRAGAPEPLRIGGAAGSKLVLDGLLIAGSGLRIAGELAQLLIRRSTLVPGWKHLTQSARRHRVEPSIFVEDAATAIAVENSILGPIVVRREERAPHPTPIAIEDSIVDAFAHGEALGSPDARVANVELRIARATVLGRTRVHAITLAENTIFDGDVTVTDRQHGCLRYCYVPLDSRTPARYACVPEREDGVKPTFVSTHFDDPGYARLTDGAPVAIARGADDRSEMGAFHDLYRPQREVNLLTRLAEYVPAATATSILFVS